MRRNQAGRIGQQPGKVGQFQTAALAILILFAGTEAAAQEKLRASEKVGADPRPQRRIVISIPDRKLALLEDGRVVKVYPVAVGAPATPSPGGEFRVANRIPHPTYYEPSPPRRVIGPGAANPLGTRWIGLTLKGYGIHGTNEPDSIGRRASHGCIRMHKQDVEELFELVHVGDVVELHRRRSDELAAIFAPAVGARHAVPAAEPLGPAEPAVRRGGPTVVAVAVLPQ